MRQIKGAPGLELLPSEKDPRKLRWQRVAPEQKAPQRARQVNTEDEETQRYNKLREFLRGLGNKGKRLKQRLCTASVPEKDAQRITIDYLLERVAVFFKREGVVERPSPDYPVYPKELERMPQSQKPITPVNPGYKIEVLGGKGDEVEAATQFAEHLLGVLKEIHPLPKKSLKIVVAVPERYEGVKELEQWLKRFYASLSKAEGLYVFGNRLILLRGFKPIIHEFGHFLDDVFYWLSWSDKYSSPSGVESLSSAYFGLKDELRQWFLEHKKEILDLTFKRIGLARELSGDEDPSVYKEIRRLREFYSDWLSDNREIFAYTYEQYVIWKLMEIGRSDLAQFWLEASKKSHTPLFPTDMFKPVKEAYDRFFDAVRRFADDEDVLKWLHRLLWAKF
jgi:hypothetical protein